MSQTHSSDAAALEKLDQIAALLRVLVDQQKTGTPRLLRLKEASRYLNVGARKLRTLIQAGEIPLIRNGQGSSGVWLVDVKDLDAWIARAKV